MRSWVRRRLWWVRMISVDAIKDQLLAIEADIHKGGWDRHKPRPGKPAIVPQVRLLNAHGSARVMGPPLFDGYAEPGDAFASYVASLASQQAHWAAKETIELMRAAAPNPYGAMMVTEGYINFEMTPEAIRAYQDDPESPRLIDRPGSVEARILTAYDLAGRMYFLTRRRGSDPTIGVADPADAGKTLTGRIPYALATLVALVIGEPIEKHRQRAEYPAWLGGMA